MGDGSWLKAYQFKPGKSGNPMGHGPGRPPKGETYADLFNKWAKVPLNELPDKAAMATMPAREVMAIMRVRRSYLRGGREFDSLIERVDGKVPDVVKHEDNRVDFSLLNDDELARVIEIMEGAEKRASETKEGE